MDCKHEINYLIGDKDGILCRNCGKRFKDMKEILQEQPQKKPRKKKEQADGDH